MLVFLSTISVVRSSDVLGGLDFYLMPDWAIELLFTALCCTII